MRGIGLLMAALATVPVAAPAQFAQQGGWSTPRSDYGTGTGHVRDTIDKGRDSGQLSRREARQARREADQIDTLASRYGSDGLSDAEARELDTRERVLSDQVSAQRTADFPGKANR